MGSHMRFACPAQRAMPLTRFRGAGSERSRSAPVADLVCAPPDAHGARVARVALASRGRVSVGVVSSVGRGGWDEENAVTWFLPSPEILGTTSDFR